jgi:hypothetical protein
MNYLEAAAQRVEQEIALNLRPEERSQDLYRLYALLVLVKGVDCTLRDVHNAWSTWMTSERPDHHALVPFDKLSAEAQGKDRPYLAAIQRAAARELRVQ